MAVGFNRKPLGMALQSAIMPGDQPAIGMGDFPPVPHAYAPTEQPKKPGFMAPGSKGAMIAGIIGDTLASLSGGQPVFTMNMMQERQRKADAEAQEAQWTRRREADNQDWQSREQWKLANTPKEEDSFTSMMRAAGIDPASDAGRALFAQRVQKQVAEPDVITTLPNGQLYAGPRSGLAGALTGQMQPVTKPVGKLTPISGGPTQPASGPFRP